MRKTTVTTLVLPSLDAETSSIDVQFDGRRIWSLDAGELRAKGAETIAWPESLHPHLDGVATLTVVDSATQRELSREVVSFSGSSKTVTVTNDDGVLLAVNKWGYLAPTLDAGLSEVRDALLDRTEQIIRDLENLGLRPFIVGGTLLGAVRSNELLPHDDDADVAYLSSHTHPADVALEALRIGNKLEALGYKLVRHSAAHIQLLFHDDTHEVDYHVDVFTAFFTDDGHINQPFHVRGEFREDQMLPFSKVQLSGRTFPAPADVDTWLTINYDENWRTPMPGFQLETPEGTIRRFDSWFGAFNFKREFWDARYGIQDSQSDSDLWRPGQEWLHSRDFPSPTLIELGCGSGSLIKALAASRPDVQHIASDYSETALARARERLTIQNVHTFHANLNRLSSLAVVAQRTAAGSFDIVANHIFECLMPSARLQALRLMRMALRSGGRAYATTFGMHAKSLSFDDPTTWHVERRALRKEAASLGLQVHFAQVHHPQTSRAAYGVTFSLIGTEGSPNEPILERGNRMIRRVRRWMGREALSPHEVHLAELQRQISELKMEIDENRRNSLRVAEMLELIEQRLISGDQETNG